MPKHDLVLLCAGFSCHADQKELAQFALKVGKSGRLKKVFLVHGELKAQEKLQQLLTRDNQQSTVIPSPGDKFSL
ncbi:MAG: hypothetical protein H7318_00625 [Oligoflexus sp.]|nr:hypothetical protein [Oligoflexus sp.]